MKIIKDRDEKPKGFGYVEFEELDGLKSALAKSGTVSGSLMSSGLRDLTQVQEFVQPDNPS